MRRRPRPSLSCRQVGRLLQAYLDGELRGPATVGVADHLADCVPCGLDASSYRWLTAQLAGLAPPADVHQLDRLHRFADQLMDEFA